MLCLPGGCRKPTRRSCLELRLQQWELWTTTGPAHPNSSFTNYLCPSTSNLHHKPNTTDTQELFFSQDLKVSTITANMEFGTSGNLSEGACLLQRPDMIYSLDADVSLPADGIHIDMNRLKAGEVK